MSELYERIAELCKNRGIKIAGLSKATGIQRSIFTDLKMGRQNGLSAKNMVKVANYFEISTKELMGIKKEPIISVEDDELNEILEACRERSDLRMLFKLANGATTDNVKQAIKIIEALRKE